jgi:hypothetical protein
LGLLALAPALLRAQGTAFTYQGLLDNAGTAATGSYDFTFTLFATNSGGASVGGPVTNLANSVSNGLFVATIDFGSAFTGESNWLEIAVRTNGAATFTKLSPRQQITPAPYAIAAESVTGGISASQLTSGTVPTNVLPGFQEPLFATIDGGQANTVNNTYGVVGGGFGNTAGYLSVVGGGEGNNATGQLAAVPGGYLNLATGNYSFAAGDMAQATNLGAFVWSDAEGTPFRSTTNNSFNARASGGVSFITSGAGMTLDGAPVLTISSGALGLTLQQNTNGSPNVIEGSPANYMAPGVIGSTISGGGGTNIDGYYYPISVAGSFCTIGGGFYNQISGDFYNGGCSTIGGGYYNLILANAAGSTIGGGVYNFIFGDINDSGGSVISGGSDNTISNNASYSVIAGGLNNTIEGDTDGSASSVISGGYNNTIYSNSQFSFLGGGNNNSVGYNTAYAVLAGGAANQVGGEGATVPGGVDNLAFGYASFAAGDDAHATQSGTFVWSDAEGAIFSDTGPNQFLIRASGGVGIGTNAPLAALDIGSAGGIGDPQLRLVQQNSNDYTRLRFQTGSMQNWDVAVGGPTDVMNWYLPSYGNVMSLATNGALTTGGLTVNNNGAIHVTGAGQNTKTAAFIQVASAANINSGGYATIINNPLCNGNPNAILIVTHVFNGAGGAGTENHVFGVGYGASIGVANQWCIYNADLDSMDVGDTFNVLIILP